MSSDSKAGGSSQEGSNGAKTKRKKKKSPEEYFGSEVDIKLRGLINPAESADLPPHKVFNLTNLFLFLQPKSLFFTRNN